MTRNRCASLQRTLSKLRAVTEVAEIVVVDNGSTDRTPELLAAATGRDRRIVPVRLARNAGATARNVGVRRSNGEVIAFCDDDSWWEPGSLRTAAALLADNPGVGLLAARVALAPGGETDRVSLKMRHGPDGDAGPRIISFPAFAAVVRRDAFLAAGGFSPLLFFGGEERLLALDLAAAGWQLCYREDLAAWHHTGDRRVSAGRWARQERNDRLVDWMRRPLLPSAAATARLAVRAATDRDAARALGGFARRLPRALARRRPVPLAVERQLRREDAVRVPAESDAAAQPAWSGVA